MSERFEGDFLESADLMQIKSVSLEILGATEPNTEKAADGRLIDKPIIGFKGTPKRMILGKTNVRNIKAEHGAKPSEWAGKRITIEIRYLKKAFGETNIPTLRVIPQTVPIPFASRKHMGQPEPFSS